MEHLWTYPPALIVALVKIWLRYFPTSRLVLSGHLATLQTEHGASEAPEDRHLRLFLMQPDGDFQVEVRISHIRDGQLFALEYGLFAPDMVRPGHTLHDLSPGDALLAIAKVVTAQARRVAPDSRLTISLADGGCPVTRLPSAPGGEPV